MATATLTEADKNKLFWASFLALMAAGVGFVFRVMIPSMWADEFKISLADVGALTGAALWPIAVTMIIFSLLVDKIGYKVSMLFAFLLQAASVVLTITAKDIGTMKIACICAGLGHGVVEAVINPLCASVYRTEKSKWLNILHASWPAGIVVGGIAYILLVGTDEGLKWADTKWIFWVMLAPVVMYGILFIMCRRFPVDERVEAGVSYKEMLREFGGLGIFLASTFLIYELSTHIGLNDAMGTNKLYICLAIGAVLGLVAAIILKSSGKILFFILCLIMIPLATAELATDNWIQSLMRPIMGNEHAAWAIVLSAGIMMFLRFFAGIPLKIMNPPQLLLLSSVFSIIGLYALSVVPNGPLIFGAFVLYAVGQTFYWPTVLGLVSEQFPKGGAMTLNTVSAMGLLTVGIFGFPFLGSVQDHYSTQATIEAESDVATAAMMEKVEWGWKDKDEDKSIKLAIGDSVSFAVDDDNSLAGTVTQLSADALTFKHTVISTNAAEVVSTNMVDQTVALADAASLASTATLFAKKNFFMWEYDSLNSSIIGNHPQMDDTKRANLKDTLAATSQKSLRVAAVLPLIMAIAFLLMILWYAVRGGYKPVVLGDGTSGGGH